MKTTDRSIGWILPAVLLLVSIALAGAAQAATPRVSAGENHTVYLHADGTLWAAGLNQEGQLGDGTLVSRNAPVQIGTDNHWQALATGATHTLALKSDGTLWAWGGNASGQLGALAAGGAPVASQQAPLQIGSDRDWIAVAAGSSSSYALKANGALWAWGGGAAGQLGNGTSTRQNQPVAVLNPGGGRYTAVAAGADHVLALQGDGSLWSWGANASGQLGLGGGADASTPVQIVIDTLPSDNDWSAVAAGGAHSLALKADGTLWAWGDNASGQLGTGSTTPLNLPAQVGAGRDWAALSAGALHSVALKRNGSLWGWGDNSSGQLGDGQLAQQNAPVLVSAPAAAVNLTQVAAGAFHSVALKNNGEIYAWGGNLDGQLGNGSSTGTVAPVLVGSAGIGWTAAEPGNAFTVARRSNGTLWSWGDNTGGQLGNGGSAAATAPLQIDSSDGWASYSAGFGHVVALKADGTLWTWGDNSFGQLGDNTTTPSPFPQQITTTKPGSAANDWAAVAAGDFHTLALKGDGTLWAWGDNSLGQMGDGSNTPAGKQPNQITLAGAPGNFDSNWIAIAAGGTHSLGLQADGTLWAWGDNGNGQLGDPALVGSVNFPSQVLDLATAIPGFNSNWKAIGAGFGHSLALQSDGTLWAWGGNFDGQLGNGDPAASPAGQGTPVQVLNGGGAPYVALAAGDAHSVALQADGSLWSWGRNLDGQLGIGSTDTVLTPHSTPLRESGAAADWSAAGSGGSFSAALKSDGTLWAWGDNGSGQLGDGTGVSHDVPTALREGGASVASSINLGSSFIGGTAAAQPLSIRNTGNGALFVTGMNLSGPDAAAFSVAPGSCGGVPSFVLAAGASCQLSLTFQASAPAGPKSALLTLATSDPVRPQRQVALSALSGQHAIALSFGVNGSIFGPTTVNDNATPSYTITAATGFHVVDVTVNGVSRGPLAALTLPPVTADVSIGASFAIDTFTVSYAAGANGTLAGAVSQTVNSGASAQAVTAVPATGYHFVSWTEGASVVATTPALTLSNVSANRSLTANFAIDTFAVRFVSGGNGTLGGSASQTVGFGGTATTVTALPNLGYHFVNWTEGGAVVSATPDLSVGNVTLARSFTANFAIDQFPVTVSSGPKGSTSPGAPLVNYGASQTFTFTPDPGYRVVRVLVDGVSQGAVPPGSYTLSNVTSGGHTIEVRFLPDGDLDGDGTVTIADALRALRLAVQLDPATAQDLVHGDVAPFDVQGVPAPDQSLTVADVLGILRKSVGLATTF